MTKVPPVKFTPDIAIFDQIQKSRFEIDPDDDFLHKCLLPVFDALYSCPECRQATDAYGALDKTQERLVKACFVIDEFIKSGAIQSFIIKRILESA